MHLIPLTEIPAMQGMVDYPKTVMDFHDQFRTEDDCLEYLVRLRWPDGVRCPTCQSEKIWPMQSPFYRCEGCGYDFTVTAGTLFADTHKPLGVWFEAIWHVTEQKSGVSALGLQRVLGLESYRTAWTLVAQAAPGHGSAWTGSLGWYRGGR